MLAVMKETGFDGDFAAFLQFLRSDPRLSTRRSADELLMRASWIAKKFDARPRCSSAICPARALRSGRCLMTSPRSTQRVVVAGGVPAQHYNLPSRPLYNLTALTLHESAPGHAFQMPIAKGARESARVSSAHLYLGLRRRLGALLRAVGARDEHV